MSKNKRDGLLTLLAVGVGCASVWVLAAAWPGMPMVATVIEALAAYGVMLMIVGTVVGLFIAEPGEDPTAFEVWLDEESEGDSWWDDPDDGG